jgi:uncharacterized membrane-anchored protein YjiN (DUF445 family)
MVGGLADWFAVTALFRRPLGLPIPHTAIIPSKKDELGRSLGDFVGANFLSEAVVRNRLRGAGIVRRVGNWLARPVHAERVAGELATVVRGAIGVLRDEDVQAALEDAVIGRLLATEAAPRLGSLLGRIVEEKAHHGLVDVGVRELNAWLRANRATVVEAVAAQAPNWSPRFVDQAVAARVYTEVLRVAGEVEADPHHPFRRSLDEFLAKLATDLRTDPETIARTEALKRHLLERSDVRQAFRDLITAGRRLLLDLVDDPHSRLRIQVRDGLVSLGRRLGTDAELSEKVENWIGDAAAYVVTNYRDEITGLITETVQRWDAQETARKIELQVGRDLQFIRVNGTVVGALAGLAIYFVTQLLP